MNALKAFVVVMSMLFLAATASAASVVTVSAIPGQAVGLSSAGYWGGVFKLNVNGKEMLAMNDIAWDALTLPSIPPWYTDGSSWDTMLYTQDDILGGAPVSFYPDPSVYSKAAPLFIMGVLGYTTTDPLWTASFNEMVLYTINHWVPGWSYSNQPYDQTGTGLIEVYNNVLPSLSSTFDYRGSMMVLKSSSMSGELLVYAMPTPVPPAMWLFGSGLLGLAGIARRKVFRT